MTGREFGPESCHPGPVSPEQAAHPAGTGERPRLRDLGLQVGDLPTGPLNAITDVAGVMVGHHTLYRPDAGVCTGVTAIRPHPDNPFREKVWAAAHVINGFGKAMGLVQIAELGTLETPIVLTNTLSVGIAAHGLVRWMLAMDAEIGDRAGTVNPVVLECSDAYLNDQRALAIQPEHVLLALDNARAGSTLPPAGGAARGPGMRAHGGASGVAPGGSDSSGGRPEEGAVGAGTGMICYGYKGGIGTASRVVAGPAGTFVVGVLVLANFGRRGELRFLGRPVAASRDAAGDACGSADRADGASRSPDAQPGRVRAQGRQDEGSGASRGDGSVIVVVATDAPLTSRQLGRLARRAVVGLSRTGSHISHGSGEFVLAFSTAARVPHQAPDEVISIRLLPDHGETFAGLLVAVADATEECVYNALLRAHTTRGFRGRVVEALPLEALRRCGAGVRQGWRSRIRRGVRRSKVTHIEIPELER